MWYVSGSRPDGAQEGRFSSWGTVVPNVSLPKVPTSRREYVTLPGTIQIGHPRIKSESALHQRGPLGRTMPISTDKATLYKYVKYYMLMIACSGMALILA